MNLGFENKVAVVTGGAGGIGGWTAKMFAAEGAKVAILDYNLAGCEKIKEEIVAAGGKDAEAFFVNLADEASIEECFKKIMDRYGRIDILANVGGISTYDLIPACDGAAFDRAMDINIRGTYLCSRQAFFVMEKQKSGAIVNVSSEACKRGGINVSSGYVASKGAVQSLTFHFAKNMARFGGRCNCVCPGGIDTPMLNEQNSLPGITGDVRDNFKKNVPLGIGYPEDIAYGILFLASDITARYITGEIMDINGGDLTD